MMDTTHSKRIAAHHGEAGLTLVELLVVLGIAALVASLAAPQVLRYLGSARVDTAKAQIRNIESALELYYIDIGSYPKQEEALAALAEKPASAERWNGPYLKGADKLVDPWGNPYHYKIADDGRGFAIRSLGRDNRPGGDGQDGDIGN